MGLEEKEHIETGEGFGQGGRERTKKEEDGISSRKLCSLGCNSLGCI
jgi:hypothetical protein